MFIPQKVNITALLIPRLDSQSAHTAALPRPCWYLKVVHVFVHIRGEKADTIDGYARMNLDMVVS